MLTPSQFERGTISYMITATLTRPTLVSPTQSCERKIYLVEKVDIGLLPAPRPRTIYLEPISKKSRRRKPPAPEKAPGAPETVEPAPAGDRDSTRAAEHSAEGSVVADDLSQDVQYNPRSAEPTEMRSDNSGDSVVTASTGQSGRQRDPNNPNNPSSSSGSQGLVVKSKSTDKRTITANVELFKGGCLPGDVISAKISVQHIKMIKSLHGVIVTLYRQGRIDSAPPISHFTNLSKEEIRRLEKEEYYPKSKTGLGGLSLTSAGSCSVFRKDLSQTFSPLFIDPVTFQSSVTASVRVPEDSFPSIRGVPGDLISFKYQVEVIVDLGGKLAGLLQSGQSKQAGADGRSSTLRNPYDPTSGMPATWNGSIIDTDPLRRQKGVISVVFEVVVGSLDTSRRPRGTSRPEPPVLVSQVDDGQYRYDGQREAGYYQEGQVEHYDGPVYDEPYPYPEEYAAAPEDVAEQRPAYVPRAPVDSFVPEYVPLEGPPPNHLSEKEQARMAEAALLPSQPSAPAAAGPSTSRPQEEDIYHAEEGAPPLDPTAPGGTHPSGAEAPSAPTLEDLAPGADRAHPTEDKQELERQRLLVEASAPPEFPDDCEAGPSAPPPASGLPMQLEPSAPALTEEEGYGQHFTYQTPAVSSPHAPSAPSEPLPKYER